MNIVKNDNFLIDSSTSEPVYKIIDINGNIVFYGVTEEECTLYLNSLN